MVTNNLKKLAFGLICGSASNQSNDPVVSNNPTFKDINGNDVTIPQNAGGFKIAINSLNQTINNVHDATLTMQQSGIGIAVGTGTTQPTQEDVELETYSSAITYDSVSVNTTGEYKKTYTATISNNTTNPIIITEVGVILGIYPYNDSPKKILLERTVLSNPITIEAGNTVNITASCGF